MNLAKLFFENQRNNFSHCYGRENCDLLRFRLFNEGNCFRDITNIKFTSDGIFHLNTSVMELYLPYVIEVIVEKGERKKEFRQRVVVKEGDPPDFYIR